MDITIIHRIELGAQIEALLSQILTASPAAEAAPSETPKTRKAKSAKEDTPVAKEVEPKPPTSSAKSEGVTFEMIRDVVIAKKRDGHRDALLEVLDQFGAAKVPDLKEEDYAAAFAAMKAIK